MKEIFENAELEVVELSAEAIILDSIVGECPTQTCTGGDDE